MLGLETRSSARAEHALNAKQSRQPFEIFSVVFSMAYNGINLFSSGCSSLLILSSIKCIRVDNHQLVMQRPVNILIYTLSAGWEPVFLLGPFCRRGTAMLSGVWLKLGTGKPFLPAPLTAKCTPMSLAGGTSSDKHHCVCQEAWYCTCSGENHPALHCVSATLFQLQVDSPSPLSHIHTLTRPAGLWFLVLYLTLVTEVFI